MTQLAVLAHADHGPGGPANLVLILGLVAAAGLWLVHTNRRLDQAEDPMPDRRRYTPIEKLLAAGLFLSIAAFIYILVRPHPPAPEAQAVIDDLCAAVEIADDDPDRAYDLFNGAPHAALHDLDTQLRREDPALALELADAKAAAETALADGDDEAPEQTARLLEVITSAYDELGTPVADCS
jgi:hypothetical protein